MNCLKPIIGLHSTNYLMIVKGAKNKQYKLAQLYTTLARTVEIPRIAHDFRFFLLIIRRSLVVLAW